jgi:hypothetical protein
VRQVVRLEGPVELAEARIAVAARIGGDIFVPQDEARDVLAPEFAMRAGAIRLGDPPMTALAAAARVGAASSA